MPPASLIVPDKSGPQTSVAVEYVGPDRSCTSHPPSERECFALIRDKPSSYRTIRFSWMKPGSRDTSSRLEKHFWGSLEISFLPGEHAFLKAHPFPFVKRKNSENERGTFRKRKRSGRTGLSFFVVSCHGNGKWCRTTACFPFGVRSQETALLGETGLPPGRPDGSRLVCREGVNDKRDTWILQSGR